MSNPSAIPPEAVALFKTYLNDTPRRPEEVCSDLDSYLQFVAKVAERTNVGLDTARKIAEVLRELLTSAPEGKYKYAQAAARYFLEDLDAEGDLVSDSGFDDDLLVVNSVAHHFGRPELVLSL
jgi:uncharacterized membrane protein YkvA (DUF1232 family)